MCRACLASAAPLTAEFACVSCRAPFLNPYPLDHLGRCTACRMGLSGFDAAFAYGAYEDTLRKLIHLFKYGRVETLAGPLGSLMARALPMQQGFDAVVPVPMHWLRRWRRGFNQSGLLAREVSRRTGLPQICPLRRVRHAERQANLTAHERRRNLAKAFQLTRHPDVEGKRLLVVDDVLTTGSTARAVSLLLKKAGAAHVAVLTAARADRRAWVEPAATGRSTSTQWEHRDL